MLTCAYIVPVWVIRGQFLEGPSLHKVHPAGQLDLQPDETFLDSAKPEATCSLPCTRTALLCSITGSCKPCPPTAVSVILMHCVQPSLFIVANTEHSLCLIQTGRSAE